MAAPTPVSSLVHSSTLVVAGCVLCVKLGNCMRVVWINGLLVGLEDFGLFDYVTNCDSDVDIVEWYVLVDDDTYYESCVGEGFIVYKCWYYNEEYSICLSIKEDTLFHLVNVVLFMSVIYSLRMVYVLIGGLSGDGCSGIGHGLAFLLITPFVMMLFVLGVWVSSGVMNVDLYYEYLGSKIVGLKVFILGFVKIVGFDCGGVIGVIWVVPFSLRWKSMGLKSLGFLREIGFTSGSLVDRVNFEECVLGKYVVSNGGS
ncbi:hypothetical protein T06_2816 [Trichinella sp. T6]|nr:hypothetical protein T06_2816 [Trichinella sp. T6]